MTASEVSPAGISWAVTSSSGCSAFQASIWAVAHSISWALFEYQMVMGPVASPSGACRGRGGVAPGASRSGGGAAAVSAGDEDHKDGDDQRDSAGSGHGLLPFCCPLSVLCCHWSVGWWVLLDSEF